MNQPTSAPEGSSSGGVESVSVIIAAYNGEEYIAEAIRSALDQTIQPLEIIVVDDGSTDGTAQVLTTFGQRITVISQSNRGVAAARNAGAAAASGTWLALLDQDDVWMPGKLKQQLAAVSGPVGLVYTDRINFGDIGDLPKIQSQIRVLYEGDVFTDLLLGNYITLSSVLIRASVFRTLGGFAEHLKNGTDDWDLWIRIAESHQVAVCRDPLIRYRIHDEMGSANPLRMQAGRWDVVSRALATERGRKLPWTKKRQIVSKTAISNAWDAARHGLAMAAAREYWRAWRAWPFDVALYVNIARFVTGRMRG